MLAPAVILASSVFFYFVCYGSSVLGEEVRLAEEEIRITLTDKSALICEDKTVPPNFYLAGHLTLPVAALQEDSSRLAGFTQLRFDLPNSVKCADIAEGMQLLPAELNLKRTLDRHKERPRSEASDNKVQYLRLRAHLTLPLTIEGSNATLSAEQLWMEKHSTYGCGHLHQDQDSFPILAHPVSHHKPIAVVCIPPAHGSSEYTLALELDKVWFFDRYTNVTNVKRSYPTQQSCEEARDKVVQHYEKKQRHKRTKHLHAHRKLETKYRSAKDQQGKEICEEFQLDKVTVRLSEGHQQHIELTGDAKSFPFRTVDPAKCRTAG